jgi:single-stranded DNA-binding protein
MTLFTQGIIRVISEPELKQVGDTALVKFYGGVAEGKDKSGNYINNAIDCEVWGKQANTIMEYVGQGGSFMANGNIKMEEWESKDGSGKRRKHVFKVTRVELLPRPKDDAPTQAVAAATTDSLPF